MRKKFVFNLQIYDQSEQLVIPAVLEFRDVMLCDEISGNLVTSQKNRYMRHQEYNSIVFLYLTFVKSLYMCDQNFVISEVLLATNS